jgi:RHS repeat-associated protein
MNPREYLSLGIAIGITLGAVPSRAGQPEAPGPGTIVFYHADHLSSTNLVTDAGGKVVAEAVYYPYGGLRHETPAAPQAFDPNYRFSDRELDPESGLQYFGARFYISAIGRFASCDNWADHVELTGAYAYARNNPLRYIDPLGTDPQPSGDSDDNQIEKDAVAPVKDTIKRAPQIIKKTNEKAQAKVVAHGPGLSDPDPAKREEAAGALVGDVGSTAGEVGGETLWEEVDEHWSWAVKAPLIGLGAGLIYGLALADTDLPVPLPGIPIGVGQGTFEISPEIDVAPISAEQEQYAPAVGLGMSYQSGPFTQSIKGTYSPEGTASGAVGFSAKAGPVTFGAAAGGTVGKEFKAAATITVSP